MERKGNEKAIAKWTNMIQTLKRSYQGDLRQPDLVHIERWVIYYKKVAWFYLRNIKGAPSTENAYDVFVLRHFFGKALSTLDNAKNVPDIVQQFAGMEF
jgi:hypothetical protein